MTTPTLTPQQIEQAKKVIENGFFDIVKCGFSIVMNTDKCPRVNHHPNGWAHIISRESR